MVHVPYWPWWLVALPLGILPVGCWLLVRRPFGVSGILARFTALHQELAAERFDDEAREAAPQTDDEIEAELRALSAEAFGADAVAASLAARPQDLRPAPAGRSPGPEPALRSHLLFLAAVVMGAALARTLRGGVHLDLGLAPAFVAHLAGGGRGLVALALGGAATGLGASLCGGCTSGHGLSGCSRLEPASLVAVAGFLGGGAATSLFLAWRMGP